MSQEKVDRYKEQKARRKEIMKREKAARVLRNCIASVILVAAVGWVGYSAVAYYINNLPRPGVEVNYSALSEYADSLIDEEAAEEAVE